MIITGPFIHKGRSLVLLLYVAVGCNSTTSLEQPGAAPEATPPARFSQQTDRSNLATTGRLIDLTHSFDEHTIYWPTERGFELDRGAAGVTQAGYFYAANRFRSAEHGGTHIDAPIHFYRDRQTVDQIPLTRLIAPGALIDVTDRCERDRDYQIGIDDLRAWEERHGRQLVDVVVLLKTGYGRFWPERSRYLGTPKQGEAAVKELHFPGLHPEAARWLVENRLIKAVGIDTASIDFGQSRDFASHVTLFERNVPALENVAHLDQLPASDFTVIALPMKIKEGTGAPVRIVAVVDP